MKNQIKILAIDDNQDIIYTIEAVAEMEDWKVKGIINPISGIEEAKINKFDIILIDYHMPDMNGLEVLKNIRSFNKDVPIIILTIDERYEIAKEFLESGANDYALKPIKAVDLISRIKAHIDKKEKKNYFEKVNNLIIPKGLSKITLTKLYKYLINIKEYKTIEEISEDTDFAYQTIHRYINFLEQQDIIMSDLEYGNVGRPKKKFKLKQ